MTKKQLRNRYRALRQEISPSKLEELSMEIANKTLELPIWKYSFYHIFLSIKEKREVDTQPLLHILFGKDKNVVVSRSNFETGRLTHYLLTDNTPLQINTKGIPEPVGGMEVAADKIQVVFLPLLAFDKMGNRIGYGMGFYDRFLRDCRKDVQKVGLSFFEAERSFDDVSLDDVPLDYCVTPTKIYDFKNLL